MASVGVALPRHPGYRRTVTATAFLAAAAAVAAAVAVPPAAGGWADQLAHADARPQSSVLSLPVTGRPLAANVSVFTDSTYGPIELLPLDPGCPTSLAIAGAVTTQGTDFFIAAPRVTLNGAACTGGGDNPGLAGVFGAGLAQMDAAVVAALNLSGLFAVDPKGAITTGSTGPLTCGDTAFAGAGEFFALWQVGAGATPLAAYRELVNTSRRCVLVMDEGAAPAGGATATPAPA